MSEHEDIERRFCEELKQDYQKLVAELNRLNEQREKANDTYLRSVADLDRLNEQSNDAYEKANDAYSEIINRRETYRRKQGIDLCGNRSVLQNGSSRTDA